MYSSQSDIERLIPPDTIYQLTNDGVAGGTDTDVLEESIRQADAEIDSYCGTFLTVPFVVVPDIIKKISVDIAIYNLYSRKVEEIPPARNDRYKNAIRQLEGISKGTISIGAVQGEATKGEILSSTDAENRVFTMNTLSTY